LPDFTSLELFLEIVHERLEKTAQSDARKISSEKKAKCCTNPIQKIGAFQVSTKKI